MLQACAYTLIVYTVHVNLSHAVWYNNNRLVARDLEVGMLVLHCVTGLSLLVIIKISLPSPPPPLAPLRKEGKVEMNRFCGFASDALDL